MARKQAEIPGFERQVENPAVEEAAEAYCKVRDERSAMSKREKIAMHTLLATMKAAGLTKYEYLDNQGEILMAQIETGAEKAVVKKTGEYDAEVGDGVDSDEGDGPSVGLLDQVAQAQLDANVGETDDGDVVVPDTASPRQKKGKKSKPIEMGSGEPSDDGVVH